MSFRRFFFHVFNIIILLGPWEVNNKYMLNFYYVTLNVTIEFCGIPPAPSF